MENGQWSSVIFGPVYNWASRSEPHSTDFYAFHGICTYYVCMYVCTYVCIRTTSDKVSMHQMFHVNMALMLCPLRVCDRQEEKGSGIDASPQLPISTGVQLLDRSRLPWSVPLDRSRSPRSAIMAAQVQSTDVFLCYQRLRVSCTLCNKFQTARLRQTTERRLAPLYDKSQV